MNRKVYLLIYSLLIVFLFPALSQQHIDPSNGLVLENDLKLRGINNNNADIQAISMDEFVTLSFTANNIISWY